MTREGLWYPPEPISGLLVDAEEDDRPVFVHFLLGAAYCAGFLLDDYFSPIGTYGTWG